MSREEALPEQLQWEQWGAMRRNEVGVKHAEAEETIQQQQPATRMKVQHTAGNRIQGVIPTASVIRPNRRRVRTPVCTCGSEYEL